MNVRSHFIAAVLLAAGLPLASQCALAEESQTTTRTETQTQERKEVQKEVQKEKRTQSGEQIYGRQLMTRQEREEYRQRMRAMHTEAEREQFRQEHHARMQERAKAKGLTLPDEPPTDRPRGHGPRAGVDRPAAGGGTKK